MPTFLTDLLVKYVFVLGRASRTEFWFSFLVFFGLNYFVGFIDVSGITFSSDEFSRLQPNDDIGLGIRDLNQHGGFQVQVRPTSGILWLLIAIPFLSVTGRRLHDTNRRAWFLLLYFIPFVGSIWLLFLCSLKGTEGDNRYGPDPTLSHPP
jgi:uncharacterized membrane protein YhaH (DUF805 family)|tara:strand:+ start:210 stop:662 length:453 start_codon:yes stop_codon:yes gene_type:complete